MRDARTAHRASFGVHCAHRASRICCWAVHTSPRARPWSLPLPRTKLSPMTDPRARELSEVAAALGAQYDVERELGRGGMGVVYLARDRMLDRMVAVKTLPWHVTADDRVRERFVREARTAARLSHPNIVPIHRADEMGGVVFFVMGYVDGESLADRVK